MKSYFLAVIILTTSLASCDTQDDFQEQKDLGTAPEILKVQSSLFDYISSTRISTNSGCKNDILIFPSWEKYYETIDLLDEMIEKDCEAFDANVPVDITDDEYDLIANAAGFDEDNILRKFEEDLLFCSLRTKIEKLENEWLDQQGDGEWNAAEDPDNFFIEDETERSLLSINSEVIIGTSPEEYIYYKRLDDFKWIEVHSWDIAAISQINQGYSIKSNKNVFYHDQSLKITGKDSECRYYIRDFAYHANGSYRIKRKSKVLNDSPWGYKKTSSLTVGYKKKRGKWRRRRTWITAGVTSINGSGDATFYYQCQKPFNLSKIKEKRRRRVKAKIRGARYGYDAGDEVMGIKSQKVYGIHRQGGLHLTLDFYDMN